jgi:hypothetical protein
MRHQGRRLCLHLLRPCHGFHRNLHPFSCYESPPDAMPMPLIYPQTTTGLDPVSTLVCVRLRKLLRSMPTLADCGLSSAPCPPLVHASCLTFLHFLRFPPSPFLRSLPFLSLSFLLFLQFQQFLLCFLSLLPLTPMDLLQTTRPFQGLDLHPR